jgi:hypothetical protein
MSHELYENKSLASYPQTGIVRIKLSVVSAQANVFAKKLSIFSRSNNLLWVDRIA